jgi:glucans biosynthesis protein C
MKTGTTFRNRMDYIDNIRIFLTILVIVHHIAIGYGGSGDWILREAPTDSISPILLTMFNAVNQSFFMSLFFLISGYFLPKSYDRKGMILFCKNRLIRLGIPIVAFAYLISPITFVLRSYFVNGITVSLVETIQLRLTRGIFNTGPLWFVEALLLYSFFYVIFRKASKRFGIALNNNFFLHSFPSNLAITISIGVTALSTYLVRIWFPVGTTFYHFQLGHHVHYIFFFIFGIMASRNNWLDSLSAGQYKSWGKIALVNIAAFPVLYGVAMSINIPIEAFLGRGTWLSLVTSIWDSVGCLGISIWLIGFCFHHLNRQSTLTKYLSSNTYTVYIIHLPIALIVQASLLAIMIPSISKFLIASVATVILCFIVSHFVIRRLPRANLVLG